MPWPDFGDGDYGLNELSSNGNTPTGLATIDLNSPEQSRTLVELHPERHFVAHGSVAWMGERRAHAQLRRVPSRVARGSGGDMEGLGGSRGDRE